MKAICDSHIHIGNYNRCRNILLTTEFRNRFKLYDCIDLNMIRCQDEYVNDLERFFAIPIIFKEINIMQENLYVIDYCSKHPNGIPVSVVSNDFYIPRYNIWKEHFLLNNYDEMYLRFKTYEYINDTGGFLIIHCNDKIREEYIQRLHKLYSNINIIIAHLGRDCFENVDFVYNILNKFNDDKFFYDLSTISNPKNLHNAFNMINNYHILYGSDYPYDSNENIEKLQEMIQLYANNPEDIFANNFKGVVRKLEKGE